MALHQATGLSGVERTFHPDDIIVSKTDLKGRITYANDIFISVSGYKEKELLGAAHNIVRHPDMPRCVYKLLWDTIQQGNELFAYVVNRAINGDHYWVLAHVTPDFSQDGSSIVGYHSNRRVPRPDAVAKARELYAALKAIENQHSDPKAGIAAATDKLLGILRNKGMGYDEFVFSL